MAKKRDKTRNRDGSSPPGAQGLMEKAGNRTCCHHGGGGGGTLRTEHMECTMVGPLHGHHDYYSVREDG